MENAEASVEETRKKQWKFEMAKVSTSTGSIFHKIARTIICGFVVIFTAPVVISSLLNAKTGAEKPVDLNGSIHFFSIGILILLPLAFFFFREWLNFRFNRKKIITLMYCAVLMTLIYGIKYLLLDLSENSGIKYGSDLLAQGILKTIFLTMVLAPIFEEFWVRGYVYHSLEASFRKLPLFPQQIGFLFAIPSSAVVFALIHTQYDLLDQIHMGLVGIVLAIARYRSDSLLVPILIHSYASLLAIISIYCVTSGF